MRPRWRRGPDFAGEPARYWTWTPYEGVTASVQEIDHVLDGPGRWWGSVDVRFWATMRPHNRCWPCGRTSFARRRDAQAWCRRVVELFVTRERSMFLHGGES